MLFPSQIVVVGICHCVSDLSLQPTVVQYISKARHRKDANIVSQQFQALFCVFARESLDTQSECIAFLPGPIRACNKRVTSCGREELLKSQDLTHVSIHFSSDLAWRNYVHVIKFAKTCWEVHCSAARCTNSVSISTKTCHQWSRD